MKSLTEIEVIGKRAEEMKIMDSIIMNDMKFYKSPDRLDGVKKEIAEYCYELLSLNHSDNVLIYGSTGTSKTAMVYYLIKECGFATFFLTKKELSRNPVTHIREIFHKAKEIAPALIILDDIDLFLNSNSDECVAVRECIDQYKNCGVFVVATVSDLSRLPVPFAGQDVFDKKICLDI
ncbi:AAA family ATPase [Butyrivibrio fibrisolvens]|uniref:AAA family ATPase n=1 Tax=Butyrivibrio fibrisolvens TaxID=831 RepID=UPI000481AB4C|nr:AAA family ATPase [Butyrivibrio fibrisolvens]